MLEMNSFKKGIKDGIPICLGYISVAFAFGILATSSGLSVIEAVLISAFNVTSAGQLAAVPIITMGGGFFELALTQLIINLRYALMSVSLSQRLSPSVSLPDRFLVSFVNTDEVFAVAMSNSLLVGRKYLYGLILTPFLGWTSGTLLGALAGNVLPPLIVSALGIALYAMFIAIVIPASRADKRVALCTLVAVAFSCILYFVPVFKAIPSGFSIIISAVTASLIFAVAAPIKDEESETVQKESETAQNESETAQNEPEAAQKEEENA